MEGEGKCTEIWLCLYFPCDLDLTLEHMEPFSPCAKRAPWWTSGRVSATVSMIDAA